MRKKLLAAVLAAVLILGMCGCDGSPEQTEPSLPEQSVPLITETRPSQPEETEPTEPVPADSHGPLENYVWGTDYTSLWNAFGETVSVDDVIEENGTAYIERDGRRYELGLDFLSHAMIERTDPDTSAYYNSSTEIFSRWWRLYDRRYLATVPEMPIYSSPVWTLAAADVTDFAPTEYHTELACLAECKGQDPLQVGIAGKGNAESLGVLTRGMALTEPDGTGNYRWNDAVVKQHRQIRHADGGKTYIITIRKGLKLSDGTAVNAASYLAEMMAQSARQGQGSVIGCRLEGWSEFNSYVTLGEKGPAFSGVHLLSDDTLSLTVTGDYLPDHFELAYLDLTPAAVSDWLGKGQIVDDGAGCYLTKEFYTKDRQEQIQKTAADLTARAVSGPYSITSAGDTVTLVRNANYAGKAPVSRKIQVRFGEAEELAARLRAGELDLAIGLTGSEETAQGQWITRPRTGYGRLCFRADFGPASFASVRSAIAAAMDADALCAAITDGQGTRPAGPYGSSFFALSGAAAVEDPFFRGWQVGEQILIDDGWIYNADGSDYVVGHGVRYRKLAKSEQTQANLSYRAGDYVTTQVGDDFYMPLALNWFSSEGSTMAGALQDGWASSRRSTEAIGLEVFHKVGSTAELLEHYREPFAGEEGAPVYSVFDMSIDYSTAVFDYRENWTIDPNRYEAFSLCYLKDPADIYWLND